MFRRATTAPTVASEGHARSCRGAPWVADRVQHRIGFAAATLALVLLGACTVAAAGEPDSYPDRPHERVVVQMDRQDDAVVIRATALLDADLDTAWRVLTDYEDYRRFEPDLRSSRVIARSGARVSVEQSGDVPVWRLRIPLDVTYDITELAPTRLLSRATGSCACTLESDYALEASPSGVRLHYAGRLIGSGGVTGWIERAAGERFLERHLRALTREIERQSTFHRPEQ